jgi:hypothetical protein
LAARISRPDPTHSIRAHDVIEDVEDRIDGFAAEVWFSQPFRPWNAELDKLANRQNREVALAPIASPPVPQMECSDHTCMNARTTPVDIPEARAASDWRSTCGDSASDLGASLPNDKMSTVPTGSRLAAITDLPDVKQSEVKSLPYDA